MDNASIVNWALAALSRTTRFITLGTLDLVPTQADKPSPHSSLTLAALNQKLTAAFPPSAGYQTVYIANTDSMEPLFDDNCVIVLEKPTPSRLAVQPYVAGDIITYPVKGGSIIHMLQTKTDAGWMVKGVNNKVADMSFVPENIITGRVVAIGYAQQIDPGD